MVTVHLRRRPVALLPIVAIVASFTLPTGTWTVVVLFVVTVLGAIAERIGLLHIGNVRCATASLGGPWPARSLEALIITIVQSSSVRLWTGDHGATVAAAVASFARHAVVLLVVAVTVEALLGRVLPLRIVSVQVCIRRDAVHTTGDASERVRITATKCPGRHLRHCGRLVEDGADGGSMRIGMTGKHGRWAGSTAIVVRGGISGSSDGTGGCSSTQRASSCRVSHGHFVVVSAAATVGVVVVGKRLVTVYAFEAFWNHRRLSTELVAVEWVGLVRVD